MIDQVLGFNQPARRRKADNASETSSKPETTTPVAVSPARSNLRKLNTEENVAKEEERVEVTPVVETVSRPKPVKATPAKPEPRSQTKQQSEQEIASPAVKNLKFAQMAKSKEEMRNSAKFHLRESIRPEAVKATDSNEQWMYKLKLIAFLIISFFLTLNAMTPAHKGNYRKK